LPKSRVVFTSIEYDEFIYSEKEERTVKDVLVTDKLLWPVLQNQIFFAYLQAANDVWLFQTIIILEKIF
jgi:tetraacyldisaccharide 4'-kinase